MLSFAWIFISVTLAANNPPQVMNGNGAAPNQAQARPVPFPNPQPAQDGQAPFLNLEAFNQINDMDEGMRALLRNCFASHVPASHDLFSVSGDDGTKHVQIMFKFTSNGDRSCCDLQWGVTRTVRDADEVAVPHLLGSITSIDMRTHLPTPLHDHEDLFRIIEVRICGGVEPKWVLNQLYPNRLVSGKFIRTFIAEGIRAEALLYEAHVPPEENIPPVQLELEDKTESREEYWLEKATGKTYFQSWGLEYNCILEMDLWDRIAVQVVSQMVFNGPAAPAFEREDFDSIISPYTEEFEIGTEYMFHPTFTQEITTYRESKTSQQRAEMTTRDAVHEFMAMVRSRNYSDDMMASFPMNTFMYFFRTHENFDSLARQALTGYDPACIIMRGTPNQPEDITLDYHYYYSHTRVHSARQRARDLINPGGIPPGPPPPLPVQHLQNGFHHDQIPNVDGALTAHSVGVSFEKTANIVSVLTFIFLIMVCIILTNFQHFITSADHQFDVYVEL